MPNQESERFKEVRILFNWKPRDMAKYLGCTRQTISNYETGKTDITVRSYDKLNNVYAGSEVYIRGKTKSLLGETEQDLIDMKAGIISLAERALNGNSK